MKHARLTGLYAITECRLTAPGGVIGQVEQALRGGARVIQYRAKDIARQEMLQQASALQCLCREAGIPLIINDDAELAGAIQADGVHLGKTDPDPALARRLLGAQAIIGVSCYNRFDLAMQAQLAGVDYVAFGRFFPSRTKPDAIQADPALLSRASRELTIPTVAIGGITPENGGALVAAGADMLAVIHGVFGQPDIAAACRQFNQLFAEPEDSRS